MDLTTTPTHSARAPTSARASTEKPVKAVRTRTMIVVAVIALSLIAVLLTVELVRRSSRNHQLASATAAAADTPPSASVIHPAASGAATWSLPGSTEAFQ